jgi:hypothetical protein
VSANVIATRAIVHAEDGGGPNSVASPNIESL